MITKKDMDLKDKAIESWKWAYHEKDTQLQKMIIKVNKIKKLLEDEF